MMSKKNCLVAGLIVMSAEALSFLLQGIFSGIMVLYIVSFLLMLLAIGKQDLERERAALTLSGFATLFPIALPFYFLYMMGGGMYGGSFTIEHIFDFFEHADNPKKLLFFSLVILGIFQLIFEVKYYMLSQVRPVQRVSEQETELSQANRAEYAEALSRKSEEELKVMVQEEGMYDAAFIAAVREELTARVLGSRVRQVEKKSGQTS